MGTTLTGTTPQDTYDSLIKVTDNAPLTGSLKVLTDGLGNDSALALSTGAASVTGTLAVSGNATFDTTTLVVDATNNRVGIGTASPADGVLNLASATQFGTTICHTFLTVGAAATKVTSNGAYAIGVDAADGSTERMRISSAGNVGIGTSTPSSPLTVYKATSPDVDIQNSSALHRITGDAGSLLIRADYGNTAANTHIQFSLDGTEVARFTPAGLTFNGDTAAANALDDYEEGTWTMGISFGGASVGVSYGVNTGTYTKIGRQVTVNGYLTLSSKGSSTGIAFLTGLPFTVGNTAANFGAVSLWFNVISFANQFQGRFNQNQNYIELEEITEAGLASNLTDADFANNSGIMISATYFV